MEKQGLCLFSVHCTPNAWLYSQGDVGKEVTEPSEALTVTLGMRSRWHMLRSQGFCPGMVAIIVLISITASVPILPPICSQVLSSLLVFATRACAWLPQCWTSREYPETSKKKRGGPSNLAYGRRETLGFEGICSWHQELPWWEEPLQDTLDTCPAPQTPQCTHPKYTKCRTPRSLACPRLTGLPTKQRYSHHLCDDAHHLQVFPPSPWRVRHPQSLCPFPHEWSSRAVSLRSDPYPHYTWR